MLIFVRHALSHGNVHHFDQRQQSQLSEQFNYRMFPHNDPDITTDVGRKQAAEAGRFFKQWMEDTGITPDKIIISPFLRTIHTASIFLKEAGYQGDVILEPLIREYTDMCPSSKGTQTAALLRVLDESEHLLSDWNVDTSLLTDEIWYDLDDDTEHTRESRAQEILDRYLEYKNDDEVVLAFSHGGVGAVLSNFARIRNCEVIKFEKGQPPQSLFDPSLGLKDEPTVRFPPAP